VRLARAELHPVTLRGCPDGSGGIPLGTRPKRLDRYIFTVLLDVLLRDLS
jgi:hypothetical protein